MAVLAKFEIGRVTNYEFPPYKPDSGFYKALRQRVGQYFKDNNINPKVSLMLEGGGALSYGEMM